MGLITGETTAELTESAMMHVSNEIVYDRGIVNIAPFRRYASGIEYREVNAYWNTYPESAPLN